MAVVVIEKAIDKIVDLVDMAMRVVDNEHPDLVMLPAVVGNTNPFVDQER